MPGKGSSGGGAEVRSIAVVSSRREESGGSAPRSGKGKQRTADGYRERAKSTTGLAYHEASEAAARHSKASHEKADKLTSDLFFAKSKKQAKATQARIDRLKSKAARHAARSQKLAARARSLGYRNAQQAKKQRVKRQEAADVKVSLRGANRQRQFSAARLLGVKPGASTAEATSAYRRLARRYHPDANRGTSAARQARNNRKFDIATQAYNTYRQAMASVR